MYANEIIVFCDSGSAKHGAKRPTPVVQGFVFQESNKDELGLGWGTITRSKSATHGVDPYASSRTLYGNERATSSNDYGRSLEGDLRESWELTCKKCAFRVVIRSEKLYPALTRMRELGKQTIGLSAFRNGLANTR